MKRVSYNTAKSRISSMRSARCGSSRALSLQKRASLVGHGMKWRITNFWQVAHAMNKWL